MGLIATFTVNQTSTGEQVFFEMSEWLRVAIFQCMSDTLCADLQIIRPRSLSKPDASAAGATPHHYTILRMGGQGNAPGTYIFAG